jgi:hypothetical protein
VAAGLQQAKRLLQRPRGALQLPLRRVALRLQAAAQGGQTLDLRAVRSEQLQRRAALLRHLQARDLRLRGAPLRQQLVALRLRQLRARLQER